MPAQTTRFAAPLEIRGALGLIVRRPADRRENFGHGASSVDDASDLHRRRK
jgi:hypothetical protein